MNPQRDAQNIRFVGTLSFGIGAVLMILTLVVALLALFAGLGTDITVLAHGVISFIIALLTSAILMGCGNELQRAKTYGWSEIENIRLVWTSEVLAMVVVCIVAPWFIQPLTYIGILMILLLFAIRGAIIRLSR